MAVEDEVNPSEEVIDPQVEEVPPQDEPEQEAEPEVYEFEAESPPQEKEQDNSVIRDLRKRYEESQKQLKELKAQIKPEVPKLSPKPTLESCEFDADLFESQLANWYEQKRKVDEVESKQREQQESQQREWESKRAAYEEAKKSFPKSDFEDAEDNVKAFLDETQQGVLVHVSSKPDRLVYALGKDPAKLKEVASIKDPLKLAAKLAQLEGSLMSTKRTAPPPERTVKSGGTSPVINEKAYEAEMQKVIERGGSVDELRRLRKSLSK